MYGFNPNDSSKRNLLQRFPISAYAISLAKTGAILANFIKAGDEFAVGSVYVRKRVRKYNDNDGDYVLTRTGAMAKYVIEERVEDTIPIARALGARGKVGSKC